MDALLLLCLCCILLGCLIGVLAGLLGIGGGLIIVPVLLFLFQSLLGIGIEHGMPMAIASSLSTVIFTGLSSAYMHYRLANIDLRLVRLCALGIGVGAILGAWLATEISGVLLQRIFACLVILLALNMLFGKTVVSNSQLASSKLISIGLGSGFVSALMGIGGGALIVPALVWFRIHLKKAIGCAALCGVVVAFFGSISFVVNGWNASYLPEYALGYVYLPATIGISLTSMLTAPIGAKLTGSIDTKKLKRIFAILLVIVSIRMIIGLE